MGGDIEKIRNVGRYMIEIWKACGMDMRNVQVGLIISTDFHIFLFHTFSILSSQFFSSNSSTHIMNYEKKFLWASEEINSRPAEYWSRVIDIGRR